MSRHYNSASRAFRILEQVAQQRNDATTLDVWAKVFGIDEPSPNKRVARVTRMVDLLYEEVEHAHQKMQTVGFSPQFYEPTFKAIFEALNVQNLQNQWITYKQYLAYGNLNNLGMCAEIIADEGSQVDDVVLADIKARLVELRHEIGESDLPNDVKAFFFRHIDLIMNAIAEYPIRGPVVFGEAAARSLTLVSAHQSIIENYKTDETFARSWQVVSQTWGRIKEGTEHATAAYLVYEALKLAYQYVPPLLPGILPG